MSISIKGGNSGNEADVNDEKELVVRAINETELEHASAKLGSAYSWDSGERDIDAGDTMLFVKNTTDTPLILDRAIINGSNVVCTWEFYIGADTTTPSGTDAAQTNLNETFTSTSSEAVFLYDETAIADGSIVGRVKTPISGSLPVSLDGIVLGKGHYIQFNQETESTSGSVILIGHFANPS
jgi:hypothetical protein